VVRQNAIRVESRLLTATHDNESVTACLAIGKLAHLYPHLSSFFCGIPEHGVRRPNHSGDGGLRALARIELYNLDLDSLPLLGLRESLSPVQDVFGPRGNSGHTHSSAV
jgi:hypothetical protein